MEMASRAVKKARGSRNARAQPDLGSARAPNEPSLDRAIVAGLVLAVTKFNQTPSPSLLVYAEYTLTSIFNCSVFVKSIKS